MQHKISEMCEKVNVMYEKAMNLRRLKYDIPKDVRTEEQNKLIDWLVADIQQLARDIAYDTRPYEKEKDE